MLLISLLSLGFSACLPQNSAVEPVHAAVLLAEAPELSVELQKLDLGYSPTPRPATHLFESVETCWSGVQTCEQIEQVVEKIMKINKEESSKVKEKLIQMMKDFDPKESVSFRAKDPQFGTDHRPVKKISIKKHVEIILSLDCSFETINIITDDLCFKIHTIKHPSERASDYVEALFLCTNKQSDTSTKIIDKPATVLALLTCLTGIIPADRRSCHLNEGQKIIDKFLNCLPNKTSLEQMVGGLVAAGEKSNSTDFDAAVSKVLNGTNGLVQHLKKEFLKQDTGYGRDSSALFVV